MNGRKYGNSTEVVPKPELIHCTIPVTVHPSSLSSGQDSDPEVFVVYKGEQKNVEMVPLLLYGTERVTRFLTSVGPDVTVTSVVQDLVSVGRKVVLGSVGYLDTRQYSLITKFGVQNLTK